MTHTLQRCSSFQKYNEEQFTPAKIDNAAQEVWHGTAGFGISIDPIVSQVLITKHGLIDDKTYIDPRSKQSFNFDHLRKVGRWLWVWLAMTYARAGGDKSPGGGG